MDGDNLARSLAKKTGKYLLAAALTGILWLGAVAAQADGLIDVNVSDLIFQAASGNNSCAGLPCTETFNIAFEWDNTTDSLVAGTDIVNASGALSASDLPAANDWTFLNALYPTSLGLELGLEISSVYTAPQDYIVLADPNFIFPLVPGSYSYAGAEMFCYASNTQCYSLFDFYSPSGPSLLPSAIAGAITISAVPEPSTLLLFGPGLLGLAAARRKWLASRAVA